MAETYDPRVYGCRINLEHIRGLLPDGMFKRYGDVVELKAEKIDDDSAPEWQMGVVRQNHPNR
ncbi:phage protein V [Salmonella bongori]|nr:phage protein V [Salmonella bongori]